MRKKLITSLKIFTVTERGGSFFGVAMSVGYIRTSNDYWQRLHWWAIALFPHRQYK